MELTSPTDFAKETVQTVQDYSRLAGQSIVTLFRYPRYFADMLQQADLIGVGSLPIVILTGFFTGAVLALNSANTLQRFGSLSTRTIGFGWYGSRVRSGIDRAHGRGTEFFGHGQRTGLDGRHGTN